MVSHSCSKLLPVAAVAVAVAVVVVAVVAC